jgi:hypothetical protein
MLLSRKILGIVTKDYKRSYADHGAKEGRQA